MLHIILNCHIFAAHYCSRISALNSFVCLYKTQEATEKKYKDISSGNDIRTYGINVWILSLCYTLANKPLINILFHTFIHFPSHKYNLTCQLRRSGVYRPPGGGLQQLFSPNSCHYFKLDQQIHLRQFSKMEGKWNQFFLKLKVNSDFSGSRQYLTFRHQQLQKLQKLKEHRFLGGISAVMLQPDLKLCILQKENCRSVPLM